MQNDKILTPVLLGADLCAYSVARAFHEYTGVVSHAFGRYKCGITGFSKILKTHVCAGLLDIKTAGPALFDFAVKNKDKRLILIPCSDLYTEIAAETADRFRDYYCSVLPRRDLRHLLKDKITFYNFLEEYGIPFPKTKSVTYAERKDGADDFEYPAVLKPADSAHYWKYCKFSGMRKVYFPKTKAEAEKIIEKIYASGYRGKIAIQELIGAKNPHNSVLTVFCQNKKAVRAVYGKVILEETGVTSHGNHAAIITAPITPLCERLIKMLESLEYEGFANFDIISDGKDEYVLEINLRQGRSCDYMRAAGVNIAEVLTKTVFGEKIEPSFNNGKVYWRYPPHSTVKLLSEKKDVLEAEALIGLGLEYSPLEYDVDTEHSILRRAYVDYHGKRLNKAFIKNAGRGYI